MSGPFKDSRPMIEGTAAGFGVAAIGGAIIMQGAPAMIRGTAGFGHRAVSVTYQVLRSNEIAAYAVAFGFSIVYVALILALKIFGVDVGNQALYAVGAAIFSQSMLSIYIRFDGLSKHFPDASRGYQLAWCWATLATWIFSIWMLSQDISSSSIGEAVVFLMAVSAIVARLAFRFVSIRRKSQACTRMAMEVVEESNGQIDLKHARKAMKKSMSKILASSRVTSLKVEISSLIVSALIIGYLTDYIRI